jgi:hypothetical protein
MATPWGLMAMSSKWRMSMTNAPLSPPRPEATEDGFMSETLYSLAYWRSGRRTWRRLGRGAVLPL